MLFIGWSRPVLIRLLACDREAGGHLKSGTFVFPFGAAEPKSEPPPAQGMEGI